MSTFTMPKESWESASGFGKRENPPPHLGALMEITSVDVIQGKKNPGDTFYKVNLVTEIEEKEYKFDQWFRVVHNEEQDESGQDRWMGFTKLVGRMDTVTLKDGVGTQDLDAMEETIFTCDIVHNENKKDPSNPYVNLNNITPQSHSYTSFDDSDPETSEEEEETAEAPKPSKPMKIRKPGSGR